MKKRWDVEYHETMWAEMKPDCYAGENCDELEPRWWAFAEGDMGDGCDPDPIELSPATFPPGTKVVISVPVCPSCHEPNHNTGFQDCDCGFSWESWARDRYG